MHKGHTGAQTSIVRSPGALKRRRKAREAEEKRWAAKAGPVIVTRKGAGPDAGK
jgi:hypothetical protein